MSEVLTTRARPEWIATSPDQAIPKVVKLRIWEREGGRCYLSGRKIMPGDKFEYEHVIALAAGGEHRESNIRLALSEAHKAKTATDVKTAAKIRRVKLKHVGAWPAPIRKMQSRPFPRSRRDA